MTVIPLGAVTCPQCSTPAMRKRITTNVAGTHPIVLTRCLCDARVCAACKGYTTNPGAHRCVHCNRHF